MSRPRILSRMLHRACVEHPLSKHPRASQRRIAEYDLSKQAEAISRVISEMLRGF